MGGPLVFLEQYQRATHGLPAARASPRHARFAGKTPLLLAGRLGSSALGTVRRGTCGRPLATSSGLVR
jgi:hypothetical protein